MKAFFIIIALMLVVSSSFAQLVQDETVEGKYRTFQLDGGDVKYVKYNKKAEVIDIYNLNHSLWKSVKIPLPKGHILDEIKLISTRTFNNNDAVEILYSCVIYDLDYYDVESSLNQDDYVHFTLNIIDENGKSLLKVDDSNDYEIIESNGVKKLLVYKHISRGFNSKTQTIVFSIPQ
nr:hypothetical protein [uncultured Carboxylicivirga sp.]